MADLRKDSLDNEHVISILEKLVETNRDAQDGYRDAAEHVKDEEIREFFNEQSTARAQFAGELENEIIRLGKHDPDRGGSATAAIHRRWIDLKASVGGGDHSILSSVESAEDNAKHEYEKAMRENIPADIVDILDRHYLNIVAAHDQVKHWRDRAKAA